VCAFFTPRFRTFAIIFGHDTRVSEIDHLRSSKPLLQASTSH
jgi:hypothetical protein